MLALLNLAARKPKALRRGVRMGMMRMVTCVFLDMCDCVI